MNPTKHCTPLFRSCIDGQTAGAVPHASAVVLSGGKSRDVELTKNAPRFFSGVRRCKNANEAPRMPKIRLDRSLGCGRSAGLKGKAPSRFGAAVRIIEQMLDPLETDRHRQYRWRRRERARYEKDRSADRAVIVIVVGILPRSRRRWLRKCRAIRGEGRSARAVAYAAKMKTIEMNVAKGERNLQRQCGQRQQRSAPLIAMNKVHLVPALPRRRHANVTK